MCNFQFMNAKDHAHINTIAVMLLHSVVLEGGKRAKQEAVLEVNGGVGGRDRLWPGGGGCLIIPAHGIRACSQHDIRHQILQLPTMTCACRGFARTLGGKRAGRVATVTPSVTLTLTARSLSTCSMISHAA